MTTKHTPGPWKASWTHRIDGGKRTGTHVILSAGTPEEHYWIPQHEGNPQDEANARLIAAAPDLLEALKELYWTINGNNRPPKYAEISLKKAKAAINQSYGGATAMTPEQIAKQEEINEIDLQEMKDFYGGWDELRKVIDNLEDNDKEGAWVRHCERAVQDGRVI